MAKIRVTRTLVYEGDESWVRGALVDTALSPGKNIRVGNCDITETERKEEILPDADA